ncbi:glutathione S-transferase N-terminal domain-containing protein [Marivibrio halodurans]|uniref:Glutathione S-transferase N-terminal domain-containing protein n=1 Tax=Marivibrio halodurans TaxID=2039722 RepID=A0A8J7RZ57_9PROT|nr:glutathione S-transferase N-terminal domain-containing protein [Marivibrio halodurans]MBP5855749.1 glutathione S-transferase N-terminal domain-containing protein [Marivibrio halodurans]
MTITLYELTGADDDLRFSPYVWRIRLALAHKGLDHEGVAWRFTEKDAIAFSGQGKVPVLVDGDKTVIDSWDIACHLEDAYPDHPSLFGGEAGRAGAYFVKHWFETGVNRFIAKMVVADVWAVLHEKDKSYFRETREKALGKKLEEVCTDEDAARADLAQALTPMRAVLQTQPYLGGAAPNFMDYIPFAAFMWARCSSPRALLESDDPVHGWRERMLDSLGGMPRAAKCVETG